MKPCGSGSVAAACRASFNRSARRVGSRTCASCSVKASTLCWNSATTACLASSVKFKAPLSGRGVHSDTGSSRYDEAVAVAGDARNLALWQRLQVGVGVDAAPFVTWPLSMVPRARLFTLKEGRAVSAPVSSRMNLVPPRTTSKIGNTPNVSAPRQRHIGAAGLAGRRPETSSTPRLPQVSTLNPTGLATPEARRRMALSAINSVSNAFTRAGVAADDFRAVASAEKGFHGFHVPGASGSDGIADAGRAQAVITAANKVRRPTPARRRRGMHLIVEPDTVASRQTPALRLGTT